MGRLITAARAAQNERGQSLLEVLLALPVLLSLFLILVRSNTAIQMSIVNQKYARAQALYLAQNSSYYPRRDFTEGPAFVRPGNEHNRMTMGVADNVFGEGPDQEPVASSYRITPKPNQALDPSGDIDAERISQVRVYNTVALCTPSVVVQGGSQGGLIPARVERRPSNLNEGVQFRHCYSALDGAGGSQVP